MTELGDLLAAAGYSSGDFLPQHAYGDGGQQSTTSSSYINVLTAESTGPIHQWDVMYPGSVQTALCAFGSVDPSSDQIDVRLQNVTDGDTIAEQTGITGSTTNVTLGPVDYTPPTTGSFIKTRLQIRNNDNATSVTVFDPLFIIGVRI